MKFVATCRAALLQHNRNSHLNIEWWLFDRSTKCVNTEIFQNYQKDEIARRDLLQFMWRSDLCWCLTYFVSIVPDVSRSLQSLLIYWALFEWKHWKFVKRLEILDIFWWSLLQLVGRFYYYIIAISTWRSNDCIWIDRFSRKLFQNTR